MKILVDTSVWSLALRRSDGQNKAVQEKLSELIDDARVQMIGPVRQEILSGIKSQKQFNDLKNYLSFFPDLPLASRDFEQAAFFFNTCRKNGIQGSNTDFIICSIAVNYNLEILTNDEDFLHFQKYIPIKLHFL